MQQEKSSIENLGGKVVDGNNFLFIHSAFYFFKKTSRSYSNVISFRPVMVTLPD